VDNWFGGGCFSFSWFVQLEIQYAVTLTLIFVLYTHKRVAAHIILTVLLVNAFVLLFVLSSSLPSSVETAISPEAQLYFKSFYSHHFFYLWGAILAFAFEKESFRSFINTYFSGNAAVFAGFQVVAFALVVLIVSLPGVWTRALQLELAFCRLGISIAFLIFFTRSMAGEETHSTYIHKLAKLSYPIILTMGLVAICGYWGLDTFAYVDAINLATNTVSTLLISIPVGGFLGVVFDFAPFLLRP
jgi:hypothetical protein